MLFFLCFQVQTAINSLLESTASRTCKMQNEMSNLQEFSCSVKSELTTHMETIATNYLVAASVMDSGKDGFEKCLQQWYQSPNNDYYNLGISFCISLSLSILLELWSPIFIFYYRSFSMSESRMGVSQLRNSRESVLDLQKRNVGSLDSIVR